jgi:PPOX class probable F420-dependent enzyme
VLTWSDVSARLEVEKVYWLHTTGPDGAPNASPVWGASVAETLYVYSRTATVKARNLSLNPRVALHLESGTEVLIVHGELEHRGHPRQRPEVLNAFGAKYHEPDEVAFLPSEDPAFDVLYALEPRWAITWSLPDTAASTRRWARR